MEVILAVPLSLLTIRYLLSSRFAWEPRQCLTYGFLISLTILARLDTVLLLLRYTNNPTGTKDRADHCARSSSAPSHSLLQPFPSCIH